MNKNLSKGVVAVFAAFSLFACSSNEIKPEATATDFLNAYLTTDFTTAATFCTPKLQEELLVAVKDLENIEEPLKKKMAEKAAEYKAQIDNTAEIGRGDTLLVTYSLVKTTPDSLALNAQNLITSNLSLVKNSEGKWLVDKLNR